jgi:hypothetical protein
MLSPKSLLLGIILFCCNGILYAQTGAAYRVLFGVTDTSEKRWDGSLQVKSVGPYELEPWRFDEFDRIDPDGTHFRLSTHHAHLTGAAGPVVANGFVIVVHALAENSEFAFTTAQGDFSFRAAEVRFAQGIYRLGGRVYIDRVPEAVRLTSSPEEEDYPSLASSADGTVWLAYMQFHPSPDANALRSNPHEVPKDFKAYAEPTGGDQIWARKFSQGSWGDPIAVTSPGGDRYKTAVAIDGTGRTWVFWSENGGGNFDIWGRAVDSSGAKELVQISKEAGSDIDPVATTDSSGRVWVAWQGWRDGVAGIYAAHQEGRGFSNPVKVSSASRNEWNPVIAADRTGRVTVAWDSYRHGNYDVYARTYAGNSWGSEIPIAATERYEAYPSISYDSTGRLWIAYEEGGRSWGKDFGAYDTAGVSVYQGRLIKLRGLEPNGSLVTVDADLDKVLIGAPNARADRPGRQTDSQALDPDPANAQHRSPDATAANYTRAAKNSLPRLAIDSSGRIWLAFRTPHPSWWSSVGTVWSEYLVSFDGQEWTAPIFLDHSDNGLDNRPALLARANGGLLMVRSSDGRRDYSRGGISNQPISSQFAFPDSYNNDLWSDEVDLGPASRGIPVVAVAPEPKPAGTSDSTGAAAIDALHDYRGGPARNLRIVRGEFHRHSDISFDGGDDGSLLDQWRYILDAAALDWVGCCDHDNGGGKEYSWWTIQKLTDVFYTPGRFAPMFSYERSVRYPDGHRNVIFVQRGIRPLPRFDPWSLGTLAEEDRPEHTADTQMLYAYLRQFNGVVASHTSATWMGTDWRDNDPDLEPAVEIYQGDRQNYERADAPRANSERDSIGGWRPKGFVSQALDKGYKLGFEASSDHISTHISYACLYVKDLTRESVLAALKERHIYAATDDILADVESGPHMLGEVFSTRDLPTLKINLRGNSPFAKVSIIRDGKYVYTATPHVQNVELSWRDEQPNKGKMSYYYVRGEQENGELVWVSPLWITYTGE